MYIHILGVTCAGKDTLIEHIVANNPNCGAIQVGKEFRRRYPAGFFKGLGAMASTEKEALEIYTEEREKCKDKQFIFVSSQPRLITQVRAIEESEPGARRIYIFLRASDEEINRRIEERFPLDSWSMSPDQLDKNQQSRNLACQRVTNDRIQNYDVLLELIVMECTILVIDTCPVEVLADLVMSYIQHLRD